MTALRGLASVMAALLVWVLPLVWLSAGGAAAQATCGALTTGTGGTVTFYNEGNQTFCVHTFTSNGTFTLTQPVTIDHLIVGGGGGGGAFTGGGGGMLTGAGSRAAGTYNIVVGAGGAGDSRTQWPNSASVTRGGQNGGASSAFGIAAAGGGGSGTYNQGLGGGAGFNGASGGGASFAVSPGLGTAPQGTNGGTGTGGLRFTGGGGGGAEQAGFNGTDTMAGRGGDGRVSSITGAPVTYAGGGAGGGDFRFGNVAPNVGGAGGGGASRNETAGESGTPGLGGGGAGSRSADWNTQSTGGNGGSGVVILRYIGNTAPVANAGADITVSAGATVSLNGGSSTDAQGNITSYAWTRVTGSSGTLSDENSAQASFATVAPTGPSQSFVFRLTVTDAFGLTSTDDVTVTVNAIESPNQPAALGGNRVYDYLDPATQRTFRVHVFETNGTFTLDRERDIEYLIVGGGGGGGAFTGGGGGGGGMLSGTVTRQPGAGPFPIVVGPGGAGDSRTNWANSSSIVRGGQNGGDSSAFGIAAAGGGGGGTYNAGRGNGAGFAGGSGGGASLPGPAGTGTAGQGNNGATGSTGGFTGGGGGGAGQAGFAGNGAQAGRGGDGRVSSMSGVDIVYAGGGAGGADPRSVNMTATNVGGAGGGGASSHTPVSGAGTPGLGGGGAGGRSADPGVQSTGGNGGSGVVILRYVVNNPPVADAGADATAFAGLVFALDGSATTDVDGTTPSGNITTYLWEQINIPAGGSAVTLTGADTAQASFTPSQPANGTSEALTFRLTVTDSFGVQSTDEVTITLQAMADLVATKTARVFSEDGTGCGNLSASPPAEPTLPAAIPGACIEYTIRIENTGPVEATGIELTDNLPSEVTYVAAETAGWTAQTLTTAGNAVIVSDGVIAAGATGATAATITIRALVK